jgi:ABC-type amino acid transport substrate-binding protein
MAAPAGFEKALTSDAYYRSSYVFVCRRDRSRKIHSLDDPALRSMKIGVVLTGGDNTPPTHALAKRHLIDNITGYPVFDETAGKPGEKIISAVASGEIDVAIAWGPSASYFARQQLVPLEVSVLSPTEDREGDATLPFTFEICIGLRRSEKELRDRVNRSLVRRRVEIETILDSYGVPRLPLTKPAGGAKNASKDARDHDGNSKG